MGGDDDGTWSPDGAGEGTWNPEPPVDGPADAVPSSAAPGPKGPRFRLGPEVARGGLGRIVEAWDDQLDREVAVKQLLKPSPGAEARFDREMHLTARLQHPNIVPVFAGGRLEGAPFLAMRRVHGRSLGEVLDEAGGLDERMRLLPHLIDVANALAYAHGQRVVHRDLKPDNVLVGDFGETVVIDWGLAKDLDADLTEEAPLSSLDATPSQTPMISGRRSTSRSLTRVGSVMGTPRYMAPEQAAGGLVDARSDVYALGAMLYELLAGVPPYEGANDVLAAVREGPPTDVATVVGNAPKDLVAVVRRAMEWAPEARYEDASSFAADLSRFLEGRFVSAYDYSAAERVSRLVRAYPLATALIVLLVLGTVAFVLALDASRTVAQRAQEQAEADREEAQDLEEAAVRREDQLRIDQARRLKEREPAKAVELLAGLSEQTPFDGRVRTLFAAAMQAGPSPQFDVHSTAAHAVAAHDGWLATVQSKGLALRERAGPGAHTVLEDEVVFGVVALEGCFLATTEAGVHRIRPGEPTQLVHAMARPSTDRPGPGMVHTVYFTEDEVALVGCLGVQARWEANERVTGSSSARAGESVVAAHDRPMTWWNSGRTVPIDCGSTRWGVFVGSDRVLSVGDASSICVARESGAGVEVSAREVPGAGWLEHVVSDGAAGVYVAGDAHRVWHLDADGRVLDALDVAGSVYELSSGANGVWIGTANEVLYWCDGEVLRRDLGRPVRGLVPLGGTLVAVTLDGSVRYVDLEPGGTELVPPGDPRGTMHVQLDGTDVAVVGVDRSWIKDLVGCGGHWFSITTSGAVLRDGELWWPDLDAEVVGCGLWGDPKQVVVAGSDRVAAYPADVRAGAPPLASVELSFEVEHLYGSDEMLLFQGRTELTTYDATGFAQLQLPVLPSRIAVDGTSAAALSRNGVEWIRGGVLMQTVPARSATTVDLHGDRFAVGSMPGAVTLWSGDTATPLFAHERWPAKLMFDDEGQRLLSGGWDRYGALYDLSVHPPEGRRLGPHADGVVGVGFLEDSVYTVSYDGGVVLWPDAWPTEPTELRKAVRAAASSLARGEWPRRQLPRSTLPLIPFDDVVGRGR